MARKSRNGRSSSARRISAGGDEVRCTILVLNDRDELLRLDSLNDPEPETFLQRRLRDDVGCQNGTKIIIIEGFEEWIEPALAEAFPGCPSGLPRQIHKNSAIRLPWSPWAGEGRGRSDLAWITDHLRVVNDTDSLDEGPTGFAVPMRTGGWVNNPSNEQQSHILLFFKRDLYKDYASQLQDFLYKSRDDCYRMKRLQTVPLMIYGDLQRMFTDWRAVLQLVSKEYTIADKSSDIRVLLVISRVRMLHWSVGRVVSFREQLRAHTDALKRVVQFAKVRTERRPTMQLENQINEILTEYEYFDSVLATMKELYMNLLDLEFNIQSVRTNQAVSVITYLAFIFVPLSFLAAIFGISTIEAPVRLFAILCVPVVLVSFIAALLIVPTIRRFEEMESHRLGMDRYGAEKYEPVPIVQHGLITSRIHSRPQRRSNARTSGREHSARMPEPPMNNYDDDRARTREKMRRQFSAAHVPDESYHMSYMPDPQRF